MWRSAGPRVQNEPAMRTLSRILLAGALFAAVAGSRARAEIVDEVVAKINDDIITKSDLDAEEQTMVQEAYRRFSGTELDAEVTRGKADLLRGLIDRKVLLQRAAHMFDTAKMQDYFLQSFMEQQNIKSEKDLEKLLAQEGMTIAEWKKRLMEYFAPQQVLRAEVADRIAISDKDARTYYDAHPEQFTVPAESTVREIVIKISGDDRDAKRAEAEAIRSEAAAAGADFAALASARSDAGTKSAGGLLGTVKKGDLAGALDVAAFSVPVGGVSDVIDANYGFHILKVDARTEEQVKPFGDVKPEIERTLLNERLGAATKEFLKKAWSETTIWVSPKYEARLSPVDPES